MHLSGLAKQHVLFCYMASMKVVWINKEWNALIFVVYCTTHSFFRQCGWSRWCPKIPVEHSKLVTETSSYLLHRSHFWKIIPVAMELDQFNMGKFRTQYSNLDLKYTCPSLWHCWTSGNARVMHVHTFCFSYGKLNWVSPPPLWHFFLQGFLCISTAKQWNGFSFVQTNIASRVEMFLGRENFLHNQFESTIDEYLCSEKQVQLKLFAKLRVMSDEYRYSIPSKTVL